MLNFVYIFAEIVYKSSYIIYREAYAHSTPPNDLESKTTTKMSINNYNLPNVEGDIIISNFMEYVRKHVETFI